MIVFILVILPILLMVLIAVITITLITDSLLSLMGIDFLKKKKDAHLWTCARDVRLFLESGVWIPLLDSKPTPETEQSLKPLKESAQTILSKVETELALETFLNGRFAENLGHKLLQTSAVKNAGRRLLTLPGGSNSKTKITGPSSQIGKKWASVDFSEAGRKIFLQKKCPECYIREEESLILLVFYNGIPTFTCINCRWDSNDLD